MRRRSGNSAATWQARQRVRAKRVADPWTAGVRPEAGRLGLFDEPADPEKAWRRKAWLWFKRDPETGELPFGVLA